MAAEPDDVAVMPSVVESTENVTPPALMLTTFAPAFDPIARQQMAEAAERARRIIS